MSAGRDPAPLGLEDGVCLWAFAFGVTGVDTLSLAFGCAVSLGFWQGLVFQVILKQKMGSFDMECRFQKAIDYHHINTQIIPQCA